MKNYMSPFQIENDPLILWDRNIGD